MTLSLHPGIPLYRINGDRYTHSLREVEAAIYQEGRQTVVEHWDGERWMELSADMVDRNRIRRRYGI